MFTGITHQQEAISCPSAQQGTSQPEYLLSRSAFKGNILANKSAISNGKLARMECAEGEVIVRFRLWYARSPNAACACTTAVPLPRASWVHARLICNSAIEACCALRDWTIQDGDQLLMSGSLPQLGNWQQDQPLLLSEVQTPCWEAEVPKLREFII